MDGNFNNRNILDLCKPTKLRAEGVSKCFELAVYIWNDNFSNEVFSKLVQSYKLKKISFKTALLNGYYMEAKILLPFLYIWRAISVLKMFQTCAIIQTFEMIAKNSPSQRLLYGGEKWSDKYAWNCVSPKRYFERVVKTSLSFPYK